MEAGADVNGVGEHGRTALHDAVEQGKLEAVKWLLAHGANSSALNDDGMTPLDLAALLDENELVTLLGSQLSSGGMAKIQ